MLESIKTTNILVIALLAIVITGGVLAYVANKKEEDSTNDTKTK